MPKIHFDEKLLASLTPPESKRKIDFFDTEIRGLMLEVRKKGKTYYFRYQDFAHKTRQKRLGRFSEISLCSVRQIASQARKNLALGRDPYCQRDSQPEILFGEFVHTIYYPYIKQHKRSYKTDESLLRNHILPLFNQRPMQLIMPSEIVALLASHSLNHAPASTDRLLILLRYIFNLALKWNIPHLSKNPTATIPLLKPDNAKERFLTIKETKKLYIALRKSNNKKLFFIIYFLLLTGARRGEVLRAKWEDINFENREWRIERNKTKKVRYVPLSFEAMELLRSLPREGNYLFLNSKTKRPFRNIYYSWNSARQVAGLSDVRIHDLRHSFASFLVNGGKSLYEVQKILGHTQLKTTQRYAHLSQDTLLKAVDFIGAQVGVLMGGNGMVSSKVKNNKSAQNKI
ncbi:hypothetical protein CCZ01_01725 [Helicobacter monodelphidis]|uniref:site-specific integrase n=1 Tax=Helicobacter sp. 15-1451 TaxID=2004995 RepID=UPI000DCEC081|nr:site-specific integrase [Helicobacter sp. 15-1451]RAX58936.1 hypothetical protein CCZ01_01725 [Helicobacter sp. 15-1451]